MDHFGIHAEICEAEDDHIGSSPPHSVKDDVAGQLY